MLFCGVPWQWAETDPTYYTRTVEALGCEAWINWQYRDASMDGNVPLVWRAELGPEFTEAMQFMVDAKGQWTVMLLGNEPESKWQSDTSPQDFAAAANTWQALVGGKWGGPGILWGDEGRVWLEAYLRLGGPVPSVWAIHIYGSSDTQGWLDQYQDAQRWFAAHGVERPLWITETNGSADLMRYLSGEPSIVAFWYSTRDWFGSMAASDLHDASGQLTQLGELYASLHGAGGAGEPVDWVYLPVVVGG